MIKFKTLMEGEKPSEEKKKPKIETLHQNEWVSLKKITLPLKGYSGSIYSHETRCDGKIIAVLLYKRTGKDGWMYGMRSEITPPWGSDFNLGALTGGVDKGEEPIDAAVRETKEESGYDTNKEELEDLGTCFGTKSTDTIYYLYALDVTDKTAGEAEGDGSEAERTASIKWNYYDRSDVNFVKCPILSTLILRRGL